MNPYLMICVEKPKTADEYKDKDWPRWRELLDKSTVLLSKPVAGLEKPTENVWLIPLNENLLLASRFLLLCDASRLTYKVFLLDEKPRPAQ